LLNTFLSNPLESFSVLLFTFLLGTGCGSYLVSMMNKDHLKFGIYSIIIALILLVIQINFILPSFTAPNTTELFIMVIIPAVLIGIPFPALLQEVNKMKTKNGIALILGISGGAGFIGAVAVLVVATLWSYKVVLALAGLGYLLVTYIYYKITRRQFYLL